MATMDISDFLGSKIPGKIKNAIRISQELFPTVGPKKFYHFSFIYRRNKLLSIGQNYPLVESPKAVYFGKKYGIQSLVKYPMLHSEIDAISKLIGKIHIGRELAMINIRISTIGLQNSKPCHKCIPILRSFDIPVTYSTSEGFYEF